MHLIDDGGFGDAYMGICMPIHMYVYIIYTSEYICIRVQIHKIWCRNAYLPQQTPIWVPIYQKRIPTPVHMHLNINISHT